MQASEQLSLLTEACILQSSCSLTREAHQLQLEKAYTLQQRPSTAKKKKNFFFKSTFFLKKETSDFQPTVFFQWGNTGTFTWEPHVGCS